MMRREFFSLASGAIVLPGKLIEDTGFPVKQGVNELTEKLCHAIKSEVPGITKIEVTYDPDDKRVPLMVVAFRA